MIKRKLNKSKYLKTKLTKKKTVKSQSAVRKKFFAQHIDNSLREDTQLITE